MIKTFNGCSRSEIWASPKNWETTTAKASLKKNWYIQCYFFDPDFKDKYPKGFPYRMKVNKGSTLAERKATVKFTINLMAKLLDEDGFNPIPGALQFMNNGDEINKVIYDKNTPVSEALDLAFKISELDAHTLKDIKSVLKYYKISLQKLSLHTMPVNDFVNMYAVKALKNVQTRRNPKAPLTPLSDKRYNKYVAYLSGLFSLLKKNKIVDTNPFEDFKLMPARVEAREVMTMEQRREVDLHLRNNFPEFWRFMQVFFHSGGRVKELLRLKKGDVKLEELTYLALVKKGNQYEYIERPIKKISVKYWEKVIAMASQNDYLFSVGLVPGPQRIRAEQITRRWKVHVKEKLGITADFYSMKHSNLTEISKRLSMGDAARAAGHKSVNMVRKHYDVNWKEREMNNIRNINNTFSDVEDTAINKISCRPSQFILASASNEINIGSNLKTADHWLYETRNYSTTPSISTSNKSGAT